MKRKLLLTLGALAFVSVLPSCRSVELVTQTEGVVVDVKHDQILVMFKDMIKQDRYAYNWFYVPGSGFKKGQIFELNIKDID